MKTIAIINQKGGVGKSTTAHALGAGLALKGYKTLFIDLDAQGNLSYALGADLGGYGSMGVLQRPETILSEIQTIDQIDIIASTPALSGADLALSETGKEYRLREALNFAQESYDFCIIDTPPSLGILTVNALTACSGAIIPAQADLFSLQGIMQLHGTIGAIKKYCNPSLRIMGILLTRFNGRAIIRKEIASILKETAGQFGTILYESKIRECTALVEAQAKKMSIFQYAPKSNAASDYAGFVQEILKEEHFS